MGYNNFGHRRLVYLQQVRNYFCQYQSINNLMCDIFVLYLLHLSSLHGCWFVE